mmetsp:Transcript_6125/g.4635  ORF Transcript_6125/g.4635 Transcript_6125/m.4635 type:complete len:108 (-) Transcript_6125:12-335(-)
MSNIAGVILPTKFLLIILLIILLSVVVQEKEVFIYAGIASSLSTESDEYRKAEVFVLGVSGIYFVCLLIEFLIMFSGWTMFNDKANLLQITLHVLAIALMSMFVINS